MPRLAGRRRLKRTARGLSLEVDYALRSTAGWVAQGLSPSRAIAAMCLATNWSCGFKEHYYAVATKEDIGAYLPGYLNWQLNWQPLHRE
jgi:hypothetical protein